MSWLPLKHGCFLGLLLVVGCAQPQKEMTSVDFHRDVEPIFKARCINCHGPSQQQGGLRLDDKQWALQGGLSGKRLPASKDDDNELLRRVTSHDPAIAMPKEGGRLSDSQIATLRAWVQAGAPWPDLVPPSGPREFLRRYGEDLWSRLSVAGREVKVFLLLAFALVMGIADRIRRIPVDHTRWSVGWKRRIRHACQHASASWFLVVLFGAAIWDLTEFSMRLAEHAAVLEHRVTSSPLPTDTRPDSLKGTAPLPLRSRGGPRFGGTYYRGNDERSEKLFNGGYYRTATMRLSLIDEHDRTVELGQPLTGSQLFIRFDIERSPHATPSLFTEDLMKQVLLTRRTADQQEPLPTDEPTPLTAAEPGEHWEAKYRLGDYDGQPELALNGVVYVYTNAKFTEPKVSGLIHYGIVYSLRIRERTLQQNSELWLGPILVPANFQHPKPELITLPEWLDVRPIPEIVGDNTTDPKLLGIHEHLDKGAKLDAKLPAEKTSPKAPNP